MSTQEIQQAIAQAIKSIPSKDNIKSVRLFGSHLHRTARSDSDVDLLIEFQQPIGYFELVRIQDAFSKKLGRRVDLVEPEAISKYFREEVLNEAEPLYER